MKNSIDYRSPKDKSSFSALTRTFILIWAIFTGLYLILHRSFPPEQGHDFFWGTNHLQWIDWLYWSTTGALVSHASKYASLITSNKTTLRPIQPVVKLVIFPLILEIAIAILILVILAYALNIKLPGVELHIAENPSILVLLGFILGFYAEVTRSLLLKVIRDFLVRYTERLLGRAISNRDEEDKYINIHVDPRLQKHYRLAASSPSGLPAHKASMARRVGYKVSSLLKSAGFTVNVFRTVLIAENLLSGSEDQLVDIVAHEASHVFQKHWSDSLQQEVKAYRTAAIVMEELKSNGKTKVGDHGKWLTLSQEMAEDRVRNMQTLAPLYGIIPRKQKTGLADKAEMLRQAAFLMRDFFKPR